jgi:PilZ domain
VNRVSNPLKKMRRKQAARRTPQQSRSTQRKERRYSDRLPLAIPVFARGRDPQGREFLEFTTTLNISAGGALLAMRRHSPPGSKVLLEIPAAPLPRAAHPPDLVRSLTAEVLRVTPSPPAYLWGLRFNPTNLLR